MGAIQSILVALLDLCGTSGGVLLWVVGRPEKRSYDKQAMMRKRRLASDRYQAKVNIISIPRTACEEQHSTMGELKSYRYNELVRIMDQETSRCKQAKVSKQRQAS